MKNLQLRRGKTPSARSSRGRRVVLQNRRRPSSVRVTFTEHRDGSVRNFLSDWIVRIQATPMEEQTVYPKMISGVDSPLTPNSLIEMKVSFDSSIAAKRNESAIKHANL